MTDGGGGDIGAGEMIWINSLLRSREGGKEGFGLTISKFQTQHLSGAKQSTSLCFPGGGYTGEIWMDIFFMTSARETGWVIR